MLSGGFYGSQLHGNGERQRRLRWKLGFSTVATRKCPNNPKFYANIPKICDFAQALSENPLFLSKPNTGSPFSSYCFVSCIWGGLEARTKKIYLFHNKSWSKWFKNASNIAEIGVVQTHRLTNGCFFGAFPHQDTNSPTSRAPKARAKTLGLLQFVYKIVHNSRFYPNLVKNMWSRLNFAQKTKSEIFSKPT